MSPQAPATASALERLARPLRRRARAGWLASAFGVAAILLGVAAWLARLELLTAPWWVLAAWAVAALGAAATAIAAWRRDRALAPRAFARRLEDAGGWRAGALSALLDPPAEGTSTALLGVADRAQAADLAARGHTAAAPLARSATARLVAGAAVLGLGAATLGAAGPVRGSAAALWHPRRAWLATIAPVRLTAEAREVDRGSRAALLVEAPGRRAATLWLRAPGESWRPTPLALDSLGRARYLAGPLASDLFARATSGSRSSDTVAITVRQPVFLGAVTVTAHYPKYLGLDDEPVPTSGDTLLLPAGTRLETRGDATAPLVTAAWSDGERTEPLAVTETRFSGSFVPRASGTWRLALAARSGRPLAGDSVRLPIRLVADSAPMVDIPVPGADTVAPLTLQLPVVIDVRDDHGVRAVALESRRISSLGAADAPRRDPVPLPPGTDDRAILSFTLDLNQRGLLPGDTVRYFAVATDNSPGGRTGRSRELRLRLPTMSEVRAAQRQATRALGGRIDSLAEQSRRLERSTEDLAREQPRAGGRDAKMPDALPYDEAKRAEQVASEQQKLLEQAQQLKESLEQLERSAEAAGVRDTAWQRQLAEIRQQLERALTPELRQKLEQLQRSLKELNADQAKQALEELAERQRELREALEQSRELFKRAAIEGDLANLAQESRDLAREERQWSDRVAGADSAAAAAAERQLGGRTDSLAAALRQLAPQLPGEERRENLSRAAEQAAQAAKRMQQAAQAAAAGQRPTAATQGQRAADQLQPLGDALQRQRAGMQQEWRQEVTEALDRALAETSRLSERQLAVTRGYERGAPPSALRAEQATVEEGVARLQQQLKQVAGKNALVSPQIAQALAGAQLEMQQSREAVSSATPNGREAAQRAGDAVDALNAAAYAMLRSRDNVAGAASGSGLAEALERMNQLAGAQGKLAQQAGGMLPLAGGAGMQERLRQLGAQQRALAEQLERLKGQGDLPGAGEMADEAKDLARRLEAQRLDGDVVQRQERLFRRMLDAGRTLQGREEDERKERQSTTAKDDSVHLPPALRAKLVDQDQRLRVPSWEELQQLTPEERRLVMDYFRRLSEGGRP
ncbi:MAG TPA: hypothetical protein VFK09_03365 [Gemmatimonadales bacterium]|nr:hypothetical protein [Gemmatimonadales bacterium]